MASKHKLLRKAVSAIAVDDVGIVAYLPAILFSLAAVGAAMLFLNAGPQRDLTALQSTAADLEQITDAIAVYATQDAAQLLPCPADGSDTSGSRGFAPAPSGGVCTVTAGIVPFRTLGLAEDDVVDTYGTSVTYIVDDLSVDVCDGTSGRTGNLTVTGGSQPNALYGLISHGPSQRGGYTGSGTQISVPSTAVEADNCASGPNCTDPNTVSVTVGPFNEDGNSDAHFDDRVRLADSTAFDGLCLSVHGP